MDEETVFTIEVEGIPVRVRYRPGYLEAIGLAHMEFMSLAQPPKPIPISATGYRSHFCAPEAVAQLGTPEAYARAYCKAFLRQGREPALQEIMDANAAPAAQASLFG
jgi:hypothetical protein